MTAEMEQLNTEGMLFSLEVDFVITLLIQSPGVSFTVDVQR